MKDKYQPTSIRIISTFLLVLFFTLSIVILLYAQGNIINFSNRQVITTGSIQLFINTNDYQVYLNDELKNYNSDRIENVAEGSYILKIEKDGFSSWEKKVQVVKGLVTNVDVQLFSLETNIEQISAGAAIKHSVDGSKKHIIFITQDELGASLVRKSLESSIFSILSSSETIVFSGMSNEDISTLLGTDSIDKLEIIPSHDSSNLLIRNLETGQIYLIPVKSNLSIADVKEINLNFQIDEISWISSNDKLLIKPLEKDFLIEYHIKSDKKILIDYLSAFSDNYFEFESRILYPKNGSLYLYENELSKEFIVTSPESPDINLLPKNIKTVYHYNNDGIILSTKENKYYYIDLINKSTSALSEIKEIISISPNGQNIIYISSDDNLYAYEIKISKVLKEVKTTRIKTQLTGQVKNQIVWANNSAFIVFYDSNSNAIVSADKNGNNITKIVDVNGQLEKTPSITSDNKRVIYAEKSETDEYTLFSVNIDSN